MTKSRAQLAAAKAWQTIRRRYRASKKLLGALRGATLALEGMLTRLYGLEASQCRRLIGRCRRAIRAATGEE